jgi:ribosome-associated protein
LRQDDLRVQSDVVIPATEIEESASRSGGPGGQHVNKTSTRVTLRWNVPSSHAVGEIRRSRLLSRLASRLTRDGDLVVHAGSRRSRSQNRELARERLAELVREALQIQRRRIATRASRSSRERKLAAKKRRSAVKQTRGRVRDDG